MIVHQIEIVQSGPDGLIAKVPPCRGERRSRDVEASSDASDGATFAGDLIDCAFVGCDWAAAYEMNVHVKYSRAPIGEPVYLCAAHLELHQLGAELRVVREPRP